MFFKHFKKNEQEQIISTLLKDNRRLKIENEAMEKKLEDVKNVKKEYDELLLKVASLRDEYESRLQSLDDLTDKYQKELNDITKEAEKNLKR